MDAEVAMGLKPMQMDAERNPVILCEICRYACKIDRVDLDSYTSIYNILATCRWHGQGRVKVTKALLCSIDDIRKLTINMYPTNYVDVMRNNEMQAKERGVDWSMFDSLIVENRSLKEKLSQTTHHSSITTTDGYIASENIEIPIQYEEKKPKIKPEKPPGKRKIRLNGDK